MSSCDWSRSSDVASNIDIAEWYSEIIEDLTYGLKLIPAVDFRFLSVSWDDTDHQLHINAMWSSGIYDERVFGAIERAEERSRHFQVLDRLPDRQPPDGDGLLHGVRADGLGSDLQEVETHASHEADPS